MVTALRGSVWLGGEEDPLPDHVVLIDDNGDIAEISPFEAGLARDVDDVLGGPTCWIGPGIYDRHVHLCGLDPRDLLPTGVVAVRDLGDPEGHPGPEPDAATGLPVRSVGHVLTASARGSARITAEPVLDSAEKAVAHAAAQHELGAQAIKVGLHDESCASATPPAVLAAAVDAAHERSLPVIARAQTVELVVRALEAGVDELANTPAEVLPDSVVGQVKEARIAVSSTLQMLYASGLGPAAARNAAALIEAGVPLYYGTDQGNIAGRPGVDPRELDRLAQAGLGRDGALRSASYGPLLVGSPARIVVLQDDPLREPAAWWAPLMTISGTSRAFGSGPLDPVALR